MITKPPDGYDSWIDWAIGRDDASPKEKLLARSELAALQRDRERLEWVLGIYWPLRGCSKPLITTREQIDEAMSREPKPEPTP